MPFAGFRVTSDESIKLDEAKEICQDESKSVDHDDDGDGDGDGDGGITPETFVFTRNRSNEISKPKPRR